MPKIEVKELMQHDWVMIVWMSPGNRTGKRGNDPKVQYLGLFKRSSWSFGAGET